MKSQGLKSNSFGIVLIVLGTILTLYVANSLLTALSFVSISIMYRLLWRKGEVPILFFCLSFQWLQAVTKVFQANMVGRSLAEYQGSIYATQAIACAIIGLIAITVAIHLVIRNVPIDANRIFSDAERFDPKKTFFVYIVLFAVSPVLHTLARGGIAQILLAILDVKWILYSILIYTVLIQKREYRFLAIAFSLEFISGFTGFFSSFKEVIFITAIIYFTVNSTVSFKQAFFFIPIIVLLGYLFVIWTGIKGEYRSFLNQGSNTQAVRVSKAESLEKLVTLFNGFDKRMVPEVSERALDRLAYTDMLTYCMEYIPHIQSHEGGKLWVENIQHVLMPRALFPNKPILDDSEIANRYTGRVFSGMERGTSISIGYFAESYVDFGFGMFIPLFCLGLFAGFIYRFFLKHSQNSVITNAILIAIFTNFYLFEKAANKILGSVIMTSIVFFFVLIPYVIPYLKAKILKREDTAHHACV